jgi:hypothetical protein
MPLNNCLIAGYGWTYKWIYDPTIVPDYYGPGIDAIMVLENYYCGTECACEPSEKGPVYYPTNCEDAKRNQLPLIGRYYDEEPIDGGEGGVFEG